jgi:tripartite-type tricarboxylate transporter receptor subunit TctC
MISRRIMVAVLAPATLYALAARAQRQAFPSGLVRIIVPFPAGGGTDVLGRLLSAGLQTAWATA